MKYLCVAVKKEIVDKKDFCEEVLALEYFEERFGDIARQQCSVEIEKLDATLCRYAKKMENLLGKEREQEVLERKKLEERVQKKETCLLQLQNKLSRAIVEYENKEDSFKNSFTDGLPHLILHTAGVNRNYHRGFQVIEEKYYCIATVIESPEEIEMVCKKLPKEWRENSIWLHVSGKADEAYALRQVAKLRTQLMRVFRKNERKLV